jgi:hypothetical protein
MGEGTVTVRRRANAPAARHWFPEVLVVGERGKAVQRALRVWSKQPISSCRKRSSAIEGS